jgi:hypothetical protein
LLRKKETAFSFGELGGEKKEIPVKNNETKKHQWLSNFVFCEMTCLGNT